MFKEKRVYPEFFSFWKQEGNSWWLIRVREREKKWICCLFSTISSVSAAIIWKAIMVCWPNVCCHFSHVWLFMTPWTVARQASLSMGVSRQEYWNEFAMPSSRGSSQPGDKTHISYVFCICKWILYHLEKEMATHSGILAWKIPWMEEPNRL